MSFSSKSPIKVVPLMPDLPTCLLPSFRKFITDTGFVAGLLAHKPALEPTYKVLYSAIIPPAPFNGKASPSLNSVLLECHMRNPCPHVHSLKSTQFWKELSSVCETANWQRRGLFVPFLVGDDALDFLLFSSESGIMPTDDVLVGRCETLAANAAAIMLSDMIAKDLRITEHYIKELGHDLASSVQAIISKIRNVRTGQVSGDLALTKLGEVETEIMSIYRSSDTMGITVDPQYNIRDGNDFSVVNAINSVITLCQSEAQERHITIEHESDLSDPIMWGDRKAIESAIIQLVMNAIKYARGSSKIFIRSKSDSQDRIRVSVTNVGISIADDFLPKMWEFGERGREALELHANGSGIGLFTVRKIVVAHGGTVDHTANGPNKGCNTFSFLIPRRDVLKKENCFR
ncbi:MAG: hypothetical protein C0404_09255 [Verrucomicrobia bacterium]|nr:hypothetical protein [Verrucomicrobiota bacterium]